MSGGGQHARARVLVDRMRSGLVQPHHLAVAGWLGDEAAGLVVPPWVPSIPVPDWSYPVRHALQHAGLERPLLVRPAAGFAFRALPLFEAARPGDLRPRQAIEAARAWAACPCEEHRLAARAAADAAYAAYSAAYAAADAAAYAAADAAYAAYAAYSAADAAGARQAEREWQRRHMIAVLCGDPVVDPLPPPPVVPPTMRPVKPNPPREWSRARRPRAGTDTACNAEDDTYRPAAVIAVLKKLGYDGITVPSKGYWIAFGPEQVRMVGSPARSPRAGIDGTITRKNPDADRRASEREAMSGGGQHARARVLVDRMRSGLVQPHHLAVAGWLGDEAAGLVVPPWVPPAPVPDWSYPVRHALQHAGLERSLLVRLAADCAAHVLPLFEAAHPGDLRPRRAIEAARAWAACPCEEHRLAARAAADAAYAAYSAAYAADSAYAAYSAADAVAAYAADSAAYAAGAVAADAVAAAAVAADAAAAAYAADAAAARQAEREWQRRHMIAVLCGDPVQDPLGPRPARARKITRNPDADLRGLERQWEAERDPRDLARLDVARARAGRPFSPPALWRPTIEIPRSWLQWLGPSHRDGEDVDNLAYHRTLWPMTPRGRRARGPRRPDGSMRYAYAILTRGGDDTYVRLEVGITGPNGEDDDPEWQLTAYAGDVYDGAVVGLEAAYGSVVHECECDNSHQAMNMTCMWCWRHGRRQWDAPEVQEHAAGNCDLCSLRVMLRLVDHGEEPHLPRRARQNPPREWKTPPPCDVAATGRQLRAGLKGERVRVHVNLHNGCFVVGHRGLVAGYARSLTLKNVQPRVSQAGWARCNTEQVRNVHAYLEGELASVSATRPGAGWRRITYNCKVAGPAFHYDDGSVFEGAAEVRFTRKPAGDREKIDVYARGRPTKKNPPACSCRHPGGCCTCGTVQAWWREPPPGCGP